MGDRVNEWNRLLGPRTGGLSVVSASLEMTLAAVIRFSCGAMLVALRPPPYRLLAFVDVLVNTGCFAWLGPVERHLAGRTVGVVWSLQERPDLGNDLGRKLEHRRHAPESTARAAGSNAKAMGTNFAGNLSRMYQPV